MSNDFYKGIDDGRCNKMHRHLVYFFGRNLVLIHPAKSFFAVFGVKITDFLGKPEDYVRSILEKTLGSMKLDVLGGESINSTLKSLNAKVGEAVQSGLENMISSGPFKVLFGDLRRGPKNQDWGSEVANTYNEKPVAFDGFVKTTIIKTIVRV